MNADGVPRRTSVPQLSEDRPGCSPLLKGEGLGVRSRPRQRCITAEDQEVRARILLRARFPIEIYLDDAGGGRRAPSIL